MDQKKALMERIRLFVLDLDGTVYLGDRLLPGAADFITTAKEKGRRVLFFTNNTSRSPMEYVERLTRMGIPVTRGDILTAGDVTVHYLKTCRPGKSVCLLGVPALRQSFLGRLGLFSEQLSWRCRRHGRYLVLLCLLTPFSRRKRDVAVGLSYLRFVCPPSRSVLTVADRFALDVVKVIDVSNQRYRTEDGKHNCGNGD